MAQPASKQDQNAFVGSYADVAMDVSRATGVAPEVVLGQAALESGWGKAAPGNNMFGIKGQGQTFVTHEDYGLGPVTVTDNFRTYNSPTDSFRGYGNLTLKGRALSDIVDPSMTPMQQVAALKAAGYATEPDYVGRMGGVIRSIRNTPAFQDAIITNTAALPAVEPDLFSGVGIPTGNVDFLGDLPDPGTLTAPVGRVDFGGYLPDISPSYDFSGITAGTAFDPLSSFSPTAPATPNFDDVPGPTYPDITSDMYGPQPSVSMGYGQTAPDGISPVGALGMGQAFGVDAGAYAPGYHAGLGEDPYSGVGPDFNAPSFDAWSNTDSQLARAQDAALGMGLHSSDLNNEAIADRLNRELGPQPTQQTGPQLATPSFDMQGMYAGDWADKLGTPQTPTQTPAHAAQTPNWNDYHPQDFSNFSFTTPQAPSIPATIASLPSLGPAVDIPSAPQIHDTPDYAGLVGSTYGAGQPLGGFMDAMANPDIAAHYGQPQASPSMIGWGDKGLTVAGFQSPVDAIGSLFGHTPSPQTTVAQPHGFGLGSLFSGLGSLMGGTNNGLGGAMVPNGLGGWRQADGLDAMSNPAIANRMQPSSGFLGGILGSFGNPFSGMGSMFGSGGMFGGSEGYYGGGNNGPGSARGDGSYADKSGYSDNDPQGIL